MKKLNLNKKNQDFYEKINLLEVKINFKEQKIKNIENHRHLLLKIR